MTNGAMENVNAASVEMRKRKFGEPEEIIDKQYVQLHISEREGAQGIPGYNDVKFREFLEAWYAQRGDDSVSEIIRSLRWGWEVGRRKVNNNGHCRYCGK